METQIRNMKDHFILCGYGRIGRMIAQEITARGLPVVVIESDPAVIDVIESDKRLYIRGNASDDDNLVRAGISRAVGLISAVSSDADNLYIILTARSLNPKLYILSRASEERAIKKFQGAGADQVISPYLIGARKMAQAILRPAVSDFLDSAHMFGQDGIVIEEIAVTSRSSLKDIALQDFAHPPRPGRDRDRHPERGRQNEIQSIRADQNSGRRHSDRGGCEREHGKTCETAGRR